MKEDWREIEGFPDYEVSDMGRVRSWRTAHEGFRRTEPLILSQGDGDGYAQLTLSSDEGVRYAYAHHLVLETFVGPCPEGQESRHLDGDRKNNRLDNLCWGTHIENMDDMRRHGTHRSSGLVGSDHPRAVDLTQSDVKEIKARRSKGESYQSIADDFDVSKPTIVAIVNNEHWLTKGSA